MYKEFVKTGLKSIEEQSTKMVSRFMFTAKLYIALGVITSVLVIGVLVTLIVKLV